jgi:hypothetical protein
LIDFACFGTVFHNISPIDLTLLGKGFPLPWFLDYSIVFTFTFRANNAEVI